MKFLVVFLFVFCMQILSGDEMPKIVSLTAPVIGPLGFGVGVLSKTDDEAPVCAVEKALDTLTHLKEAVEKKADSTLCQDEWSLLSQTKKISTAQYKALCHTILLFQELETGLYTDQARAVYGAWAIRLLANYLGSGLDYVNGKIETVKKSLLERPIKIRKIPSKQRGHNPSYYIIQDDKVVAILKDTSALARFSSFQKHLPQMPLTSDVHEHECIGYELDALLGLNKTPITFGATIAVMVGGKKEEHKGVLQLFIPNAKAAGSGFYYEEQGAASLLSLDMSKAHLSAISGIIKGRGAGHHDNYIMQMAGSKIVDVFDIDLEECMIAYNKSDKKALSLCRLWILALPQNKKPLQKAMQLLLSHPALGSLVESYCKTVKTRYAIHSVAVSALQERVHQLCLLAKESKMMTPRDIYFAIFGGSDLYALARAKGYPDISIFNNVLSDPYQHVISDFMQPEKMKKSKLLQRPKGKSRKKLRLYENIQLLENAQ